jgi:hypothetical protein
MLDSQLDVRQSLPAQSGACLDQQGLRAAELRVGRCLWLPDLSIAVKLDFMD